MPSISTVGVIAKRRDPQLSTTLLVCQTLLELGCAVLVEQHPALAGTVPGRSVSREDMLDSCELVVVIGGDGSLLDAGRSFAPQGIPLLGVNQGRLGFMTDVTPAQTRPILAQIVNGQFGVDERLMLRAEVYRHGDRLSQGYAVNDVIVRNRGSIRMLEFDTWIGDEFISSHRADGFIVATPTGSTAYALSSGGPLVHPELQALSLVPICPHTLSDRPIVVGADRVVRIVLRNDPDIGAIVALDGQTEFALESGDTINVARALFPLRLIHPVGHSHFAVLRNKLRWGSGPDVPVERA